MAINNNNEETLWEELEIMLRNFDYTYMMSDDHRVWTTGVNREKEIAEKIQEMAEIDAVRTQQLIDKYKEEYGTQFQIRTGGDKDDKSN